MYGTFIIYICLENKDLVVFIYKVLRVIFLLHYLLNSGPFAYIYYSITSIN